MVVICLRAERAAAMISVKSFITPFVGRRRHPLIFKLQRSYTITLIHLGRWGDVERRAPHSGDVEGLSRSACLYFVPVDVEMILVEPTEGLPREHCRAR